MALTVTHTSTYNARIFADPYKQCTRCHQWVDGTLDAPGPLILVPCEHQADYRDVCPSWSPVDGCGCAEYNERHPDDPIVHPRRERPPGDDRTY
jgi:hypothetical protein